jgi:catechol 2,3-dioxygenase-like lactoylglutathione lyase family enzyme
MADPQRLRLQPMVHVEDMASAVDFYERLGARVLHGSRDGDWVLVSLGGCEIGLLAHPPNPEQGGGSVELNFETTVPLEELEKDLRDQGVSVDSPTAEQGFGRQLVLRSPDGLLLKINELRPERFT